MLRQLLCSAFLLLLGGPTLAATFRDDFNAPSLDPAWQVVSFDGTRAYGYSSPANHYSLTDRPGFLRYSLDPMTHWDGFVTNFQSDYDHSCCLMDAGLELRRPLTGDNWVLEGKADFHLPYTNGRGFVMTSYFGDGQTGTYAARIRRYRDVNQNSLVAQFFKTNSLSAADITYWSQAIGFEYGSAGPTDDSEYWQIARSGNVLNLAWSTDGNTWSPLSSYDFGTELDGKEQTLVINGLSWFYPANSYADWDYVSFSSYSTTPEPHISGLLFLGLGMMMILLRRPSL